MNPVTEVSLLEGDSRPSTTNHPTPNDPPWGGWVAVGVWLISILLVIGVPMIFTAPYLLKMGLDVSDKSRLREFMLTDPTAVILQLAPIILSHALTLVIAWLVVTKVRAFSFRRTLGWSMNGFKVWHAVLITIAFYAFAQMLVSALGDVENEFDLMLKSSRYAVYLVVFFATFTAPVVEEVIYRGLLFSSFQRRFGVAGAIIFVTILFTAVHVPQYSLGSSPDYAALIALLFLSLILTLLRARTGNLLPCIVLHTVFNATQSILLILEPYINTPNHVIEPTTGFILK